MTAEEERTSRRQLLSLLGGSFTAFTAGCGARQQDHTTTTRREATSTRTLSTTPPPSETPSDSAPPEIDSVSVADWPGETVNSRAVYVNGIVSDESGVDSVTIELDTGSETTIDPTETIREFSDSLPVDGGRSYEGTVRAVDGSANSNEATASFQIDHVPESRPALTHDSLVGAYYYLWYGDPDVGWNSGYTGTPVLGEYDVKNTHVIDQHIQWARQYGINWLLLNWWGPTHYSGETLRNHFFDAALANEIQVCISYETRARLTAPEKGYVDKRADHDVDLRDERVRERLRSDFEHLAEEYFHRDNYLYIDGRPVVELHVSPYFKGDLVETLSMLRSHLDSDVYLLGELIDYEQPMVKTLGVLSALDAVCDLSPIVLWLFGGVNESFDAFLDGVSDLYTAWHLAMRDRDVAFIPTTIPGFNNRSDAAGDGTVVKRTPERFRRLTAEARRVIDRDLNAVLISSFNEWLEGTNVEPAVSFGTTYLEVVADELGRTEPPSAPIDLPRMTFDFNKSVADEESTRELSFAMEALRFESKDDESIATYDIGTLGQEPLFVEGAYNKNEWGDTGDTIRWLGGPTEQARMYFRPDITRASQMVFTGTPSEFYEIEAEIRLNGATVGHVSFGERDTWNRYSVSL